MLPIVISSEGGDIRVKIQFSFSVVLFCCLVMMICLSVLTFYRSVVRAQCAIMQFCCAIFTILYFCYTILFCCLTILSPNLSDSKLLYKSGVWKRRKPESGIGTGTGTEIGQE